MVKGQLIIDADGHRPNSGICFFNVKTPLQPETAMSRRSTSNSRNEVFILSDWVQPSFKLLE